MKRVVTPTAIADHKTGLYVPAVRVDGKKPVPLGCTGVTSLLLAVEIARDRIPQIWTNVEVAP